MWNDSSPRVTTVLSVFATGLRSGVGDVVSFLFLMALSVGGPMVHVTRTDALTNSGGNNGLQWVETRGSVRR